VACRQRDGRREYARSWCGVGEQLQRFRGQLGRLQRGRRRLLQHHGGAWLTKSYDWGNNNAWETDFKSSDLGGNDANYADNVDFAYFSGHGNTAGFYLGTTHADWQVAASDLRLGDKDLDYLAISSCLTMNYNSGQVFSKWGWPVFKGLHMICGMDTVEADTPSIGSTSPTT